MGYVIESGTNGNTAYVNSNNELNVFAVSQDLSLAAAAEGTSYFIRTPIINLTTDSVSWLIYILNSDAYPWTINYINTRYGTTDGVGDGINYNNFGATGGTLISAGSAATAGNSNVGVLTVLPGTFLYGAEGSTITGGQTANALVPESQTEITIQNNPIVIPPGVNFAVGYQPPAGNTSQNFQYTLQLFRQVGRD